MIGLIVAKLNRYFKTEDTKHGYFNFRLGNNLSFIFLVNRYGCLGS
jgi:hypothetical protein